MQTSDNYTVLKKIETRTGFLPLPIGQSPRKCRTWNARISGTGRRPEAPPEAMQGSGSGHRNNVENTQTTHLSGQMDRAVFPPQLVSILIPAGRGGETPRSIHLTIGADLRGVSEFRVSAVRREGVENVKVKQVNESWESTT